MIYRMEHWQTGRGPYVSRGYEYHRLSAIISQYCSRANGHEGPNEDEILKEWFYKQQNTERQRDLLFGFGDIFSFISWFRNPNHLLELHKSDMILRIYDAREFCIGKRQAIFYKPTSEVSYEMTLVNVVQEYEYYFQQNEIKYQSTPRVQKEAPKEIKATDYKLTVTKFSDNYQFRSYAAGTWSVSDI